MSEKIDPYAGDVDPNICIWKPSLRKVGAKKVPQELKFPCRFPDLKKSSDVCNPCLMADIFAMQYSQVQELKKQQGMNEEIMAYLRNITSDGSLDELK